MSVSALHWEYPFLWLGLVDSMRSCAAGVHAAQRRRSHTINLRCSARVRTLCRFADAGQGTHRHAPTAGVGNWPRDGIAGDGTRVRVRRSLWGLGSHGCDAQVGRTRSTRLLRGAQRHKPDILVPPASLDHTAKTLSCPGLRASVAAQHRALGISRTTKATSRYGPTSLPSPPRTSHPFRAPAPKPTTMYFWMRKNTASTGVRMTRPAAMIIPQSTTEAL